MKKKRIVICAALVALAAAGFSLRLQAVNGGWTILAWNNLGMHCMDSDYSVFSILPPYNVINAQVIDSNGILLKNSAGIHVTYEAVVDLDDSINMTSIHKSNFWSFIESLFGVSLAPDGGLSGFNMPGPANTPQPMVFDASLNLFKAEGVPITPYDDAGARNYYPLYHIVARDNTGNILAATDIVLPVSDEMDCRSCHASDSSGNARPAAGWVYDASAERDYRLNILLKHDEHLYDGSGYGDKLLAAGYSLNGLYDTASRLNTPILCARCHRSNALPGTGLTGVPPLTAAVHSMHAAVADPVNGHTLESSENRSACYRCHPGSQTRCLRGAMGAAVAADGSLAIQCQSCHGSMSAVGAAGREGWLDEPNCQSCHTGTATQNSGQIRYPSALDDTGHLRIPASNAFATSPGVPAAGFSLYRFSTGHGALQCEACHNSTHAEYPSLHANDNIQSMQIQGHAGAISDCVGCHNGQPATISGGPHGMHPVGQQWASNHDSAVEHNGSSQCRACHGQDYRGTVLSRALGSRNISTEFGVKQFWRGFQVGCYTCHNGPGSEDRNANHVPVVVNASAATASGTPVAMHLNGTDADGNALTFRIVSQPSHGRVALSGQTATYIPDTAFAGSDSYTFAAWDGSIQSNLGTVSINVASEFFIPFYQANADSYLGIAVSNYGNAAANVHFAAYGSDGRLLAYPDNPASIYLQPFAQLARLAFQLFGIPMDTKQAGWVRVSGDSPELGCLFQFGDYPNLSLDGSVALTEPVRSLRFTRVFEGPAAFRGQAASTILTISNPTAGPVTLMLNLLGLPAGQALAPQQTLALPANGALSGTVSQIFNPPLPVSGGWVDVQVISGEGVVGFELLRFPDADTVIGLNGTSGNAPNQTFSAQLAVLPEYFTNLKLINTSTLARTVTLQAIGDDGSSLVSPLVLQLDVGESLEQNVNDLMGIANGVGSLRVDADGPGVIGDVLFGDPGGLKFAAACPLESRKFKQAVFSHIANGLNYFTGLAVLNPNSQTASITLDVYATSGAKTGSTDLTLGPRQRFSKLLNQLLPVSGGQMGGYIKLTSDVPVLAQELYGDSSLNFLSAVPPRIVR
ncbi:MAG: hypothetical protein H6Q07_395 [Acidobacteria bacterium]|nr:hypothetical protein [Acidobacteriota bacterium]